jgi:uncharacterized protein
MSRDTARKLTALLAGVLVTACCAWAGDLPSEKYRAADLPPEKYSEWTTEKEIFVPMRDGIRLSTDVLLPKGAPGKLPTVLVRTPYDKDTLEPLVSFGWTEFFLRHGYAVVVQNERGLAFSEGSFTGFLQGASSDGYDTVEWIAKQSWSNGKVGTIGCSSSAEQQWPMAASHPPGHAAMIPISAGMAVGDVPGNATQGAMYRGGVPMIGLWPFWYANIARTERLVLPADSSQEQRVRLRTSKPPIRNWSDMSFFDPKSENGLRQLKHLPSQEILRNAGVALTPLDHYWSWTPADARWKAVERIGIGAKPRVPALQVESWHDQAVGEATRLFKYLQDLGTPNQYLIIGAGPHCTSMSEGLADESAKRTAWGITRLSHLKFGDLEIGDARYGGLDRGYSKLFLDWFGYWLNGQQGRLTQMPKVQLYVMGKGWIAGDQWPLKETRFTKYFLSANRASPQRMSMLSTSRPSGDQQDSYLYDPGSPAPSLGLGDWDMNAFDQRPVEARKDVRVYSTPPLEKRVTIAGPIEVVLYVSSSAKDTDFMVKLVDVYPDGKAINLSEDAFRVRYREGFDKKVLMQSGQVYKITLPNMVTAVRFAKGHQIRLDISSSSFPFYERNLNTGGNNYDEARWVVAENSVHLGSRYPSHVILPVLPD